MTIGGPEVPAQIQPLGFKSKQSLPMFRESKPCLSEGGRGLGSALPTRLPPRTVCHGFLSEVGLAREHAPIREPLNVQVGAVADCVGIRFDAISSEGIYQIKQQCQAFDQMTS